jgi:hypothetical protein
MELQDMQAALNRLPGPVLERDALRAARWFRECGYTTVDDLPDPPDPEVEFDTAMWAHGVPPELIGRKGEVVAPGDVVYQHVVGPVYPFLHFGPGPIGGGSS